MVTNNELPPLSPFELADLEAQAGHKFSSLEEAHRYRISRLNVVTSAPELAARLERDRKEKP